MRAPGTTQRAVSTLWASTAVVAFLGAVLTATAWGSLKPEDQYLAPGVPIAAVVYASLGALIVRRRGNRIGWMLLVEGLGLAVLCAGSVYAVTGVLSHPHVLPGGKVVGAFSEWMFVPMVVGIPFMLLLFPSGELPSRRWRPVAVVAIAGTVLAMIGFAITPRLVALPAPGGVSLTFPNPLAIRSLGPTISAGLIGTLPSLGAFSVLVLAAAVASLVVRYRSGSQELRQQIKWVALAAAASVVFQAGLAVAEAVGGFDWWVTTVVGSATGAVALFGIPAAIAVAVMKYGLYEIDVIINRAVVYALLAAAGTSVYLVVVVGFGSLIGYGVGNPVLTTGAAVAIALLFQPLRRRAQRVANRLVYGERATPYQVLSELAGNMAGTLGLDDILDRMVSVLAEGTGATRVDVWIRVGSELRPAATWPQGVGSPEAMPLRGADQLPPIDGVTRSIAVRQGDELLGALAIEKPKNEPLSPTEDKLLEDLASQAGLVLRNVRLAAELRATIDELRASRRRLVEAQDVERRKIERNLHDGAQQRLVALNVQLGLIGSMAEEPERVRTLSGQLQGALQEALDELRDLARGIYPPLLADQGLAAALDAQARKASVRTTVVPDGVGRYPQEIESAVYFCTLEAMQNVAKYAQADSASIRLSESGGDLVFEIQDDGRGFARDRTRYGTGLQGMADRLDAIGGALEVTSEPGRGTLVRGRVKLR